MIGARCWRIAASAAAALSLAGAACSGPAPHAIPGTGLGLTISKAIVDAHGGKITVASSEGHGSTFTVRLPVRAG